MPADTGVHSGATTFAPPRFRLAVLRSETEWVVRSFVFEERVHEPYRVGVVALPMDPDFEFSPLIGMRAALTIERQGRTRVLHGEVFAAELLDGRVPRVRLEIGPALAGLAFARRSRVFQDLTVVEIATRIAGPSLDVSRLKEELRPRDYCVQYRETDLDFLLRILAEEGITILWEHGDEHERAVLIDRNQALLGARLRDDPREASHPPVLPYSPRREEAIDRECILVLSQHAERRPERWSHSRWGWMSKPTVMLRGEETLGDPGTVGHQFVCDEGRSSEDGGSDQRLVRDDTKRRARLHAARDRAQRCTLFAKTNAIAVSAGRTFEAGRTPHDGFREVWVITSAVHRADVPHASIGGSSAIAETSYVNELDCQPLAHALVPPKPIRPRADGVQSAVVTGPEGEEIHCDRFGRIRVRMLWDDAPHDQEETSCWLRVAQPWAGSGWGTSFVPRVGSEVLVSFFGGDPDRPICTGSVSNGANLPPFSLPHHKTRTGIRTATLGDAGDFSELSFDDSTGNEDAYFRAAGRLRLDVGREHRIRVGGSQRETVNGARSTDVGEDALHVGGDRREIVDGHFDQTVRGAIRLRVSDTPPQTEGPTGLGVVVEHGTADYQVADGFVVTCGDSRLEIRRTEILLSSPTIRLTSPVGSTRHPTSVTLTGTGLELAADTIHHRAVQASTKADDGVSLHAGAQGDHAEVKLCSGAARMHAAAGVDLQAEDINVHAARALALHGAACAVTGDALTTRVEQQIQMLTPGDVKVVGRKIELN